MNVQALLKVWYLQIAVQRKLLNLWSVIVVVVGFCLFVDGALVRSKGRKQKVGWSAVAGHRPALAARPIVPSGVIHSAPSQGWSIIYACLCLFIFALHLPQLEWVGNEMKDSQLPFNAGIKHICEYVNTYPIYICTCIQISVCTMNVGSLLWQSFDFLNFM